MDYQIGDYVQLKNKEGFIRYIGKRKHNHGIWFGIELSKGNGSCDGSEHGERYFASKLRKGIFVRLYAIKKKIFPPPKDHRNIKPKTLTLQNEALSERTHKIKSKTKTKTSETKIIHSIVSNKTVTTYNKSLSSFRNIKSEQFIKPTKHKRIDSKSGGTSRIEKKQNISKRFAKMVKVNSFHTDGDLHDSQMPKLRQPNSIHVDRYNHYGIEQKQSSKTDTELIDSHSKMDGHSTVKTFQTAHNRKQSGMNGKTEVKCDENDEEQYNRTNINVKENVYDLKNYKFVVTENINDVRDNNILDDNELKINVNLNNKIKKGDIIDDNLIIYPLSSLVDIPSEDLNKQIEEEFSRALPGLNIIDMSSISSTESFDMKEIELQKNEELSNLRDRFNSVSHDTIDDFKFDIKNMNNKNISNYKHENQNNDDELDKLRLLMDNNNNESDAYINDNNNELLTLHLRNTETWTKSESVSLSFKRQISNTSEIDHEIKTKIKLRSTESEQSSESKRNDEEMVKDIMATVDIEMNIKINTRQSITINEDYNNIYHILNELDEIDNNEQNILLTNVNNKEENIFSKMFNKCLLTMRYTPPEVIHHFVPPSYEEANLRYRIKTQKEKRDKMLNDICKSKNDCNGSNQNAKSLWDRFIEATQL